MKLRLDIAEGKHCVCVSEGYLWFRETTVSAENDLSFFCDFVGICVITIHMLFFLISSIFPPCFLLQSVGFFHTPFSVFCVSSRFLRSFFSLSYGFLLVFPPFFQHFLHSQPATEAETAPEAQPPPQQEETEYASDFETSSAATSKANLHVTWAEDAAQENIEVAPQENIEVAPEENIVVDQEQPQQQAPVAMAESDPEEQYAEPENTSAAPQEDIQSYADDFEAPPAEDIQVDHESTPAVDIDATTGVATEYEIVEEDQQQQPAVSEVMSEAQPEEGVQEDIYAVPEDTHAEIAEDISGAAVSVPAAMTEEISDHLGYAAEQSKVGSITWSQSAPVLPFAHSQEQIACAEVGRSFGEAVAV